MVNLLYAVCTFTCALVVGLMRMRAKEQLNLDIPLNQHFVRLTSWVACFCLIDTAWGILASDIVMNSMLLLLLSELFLGCTAMTSYIWFRFVCDYLEVTERAKAYQYIAFGLTLVQLVILVANLVSAKPLVCYVNAEGIYCTAPLRKYLFWMQFALYIGIGVACAVRMKAPDTDPKERANLRAVLVFVGAPIALGVFQLIYPEAPAYSIGYMLGCVIISTFVISNNLEESKLAQLRAENAERQIAAKRAYEAELNDARVKAEAANAAKTTFLFNMSHDIRTPMNAILGFTKIAQNHIDDRERVLDSLQKIELSSEQLLSLINDILEMSRIESGRMDLSESPAELRACIDSIQPMVETLAVDKSIDYQMTYGDCKDEFIYVDELRLSRVLLNLLTNAVKYTLPGGKVRFNVAQIGKTKEGKALYRFMISDTGIGMSAAFQKHLFEQFSRERNATVSKQQGTGLGLAISKKIVQAMGGSIAVQSKMDVGSTFTVTLPLRIQTETERQANEAAEAAEPVPMQSKLLTGRRCLLVDDNELNREIAVELLQEIGISADTAEDGEIAVQTVREKGIDYYDFILMDIQMPVMNGYDATRHIREMDNGFTVPIFALSANAFEEDKKRSREAGMNDHIAKPIHLDQLNELLNSFLRPRD